MVNQRAASTAVIALGAAAAALYLVFGVLTSAAALEHALGGKWCAEKACSSSSAAALQLQLPQRLASETICPSFVLFAGGLLLVRRHSYWAHSSPHFI